MAVRCASLDPRNRYYRHFGARGCNGKGSFGRWKYDRETEWRDIPCPACVPIQRRPKTATKR